MSAVAKPRNETGNLRACIAAGIPAHLLVSVAPGDQPLWEYANEKMVDGERIPGNWVPNGELSGKCPARYDRNKSEWHKLARWQLGGLDPKLIQEADEDGANAGVILGVAADGFKFIAIDFDGISYPLPSGEDFGVFAARQFIARLVRVYGGGLLVRNTIPHRALVLVRLPVDADPGHKVVIPLRLKPHGIDFGKIEILTKGQQTVIAGVHPSGNQISWYRQPGNSAVTKPAPQVKVGMEPIPNFEMVLHHILEASRSIDDLVEVREPETHHGATKRTKDIQELAAPSADDLIALLDSMPNPPDLERDSWLSIGFASAAAIKGLDEKNPEAVSADDVDRVEQAFVSWGMKWDGNEDDAESLGSKWRDDFYAQTEYALGWDYLIKVAGTLGADSPEYRRIRQERLAEEFADMTEDAPAEATAGDETESVRPLALSDDELADKFSRRHVGQVVYVAAWGRWYRWSGCKWEEDATHSVFDLARAVCRDVAANAKLAAEPDGIIRKLCSAPTIAAVEKLARYDARHARRPDEFDANAWVINTPDGVLDLRTGIVAPPTAGSLYTKATAVAPGGNCRTWLAFLHEATHGDEELIRFLRRWCGYMLTGVTEEHAFVFLHGGGGNGKGVFVNTFAALLGDYAKPAFEDVFMQTRNESHPTHLAGLRGARMVYVSEVSDGQAWAEARLKALTGGDRIAARVMRGDQFEFTPAFKLVICGNHKPRLRNPDPAMRRRLNLIPFTHRPAQVDPKLPEKLKAELGGIFAWALQGCIEWQRIGLCPPDSVSVR